MTLSERLIWWKVRCLERRDKTFFDKFLVLDWADLPPERHSHVTSLLDGASRPGITQYRQSFRPTDEKELVHLMNQARRSDPVALDDYFEDEDGEPLDEIGVMQVMTGQEYPIILGNPLSVVRIGPTGIRDKDRWSSKAANDIALLLQTTRQIGGSRWLKAPLSIQFVFDPGDLKDFPAINRITNFDSPDGEATRGVLMSIRLLISGDDVFNTACNWYIKHAADGRKRDYVGWHKKNFNEARKARPAPFALGDFTTQQLIDTFMYGSGLVHRNSDNDSGADLARALKDYGRERFIMAFNAACRVVCQPSFYVHHVIAQDFERWIGVEGCQAPDRVDINAVLR